MSHKSSQHMYIIPGNPMTVITFLFFVRSRGAIEHRLFVAFLLIIFPRAVSPFHPATASLIFISGMGRVRIIIMQQKQTCLIRRHGQIIKIIFRGNRYGIQENIWGISGSFMWLGSIINFNGIYIQIWATTIICKCIIEAVINRPVVVLSN